MTDPTRRLAPIVRLAPAKLNLTLAVVARRPDGYHALHSVVVPLALGDRLSLAVAPGSRGDTLHVTGADTGPAAGNLVLRAIAAARDIAAPLADGPGPLPPLAARLEKRIPVAAGLGGGSSDAAAALDAALEAWSVEPGAEARLRAAAALGSDVPLFLTAGPAVIEGRGEQVTPLHAPGGEPVGVLLVTPAVRVRTPDVFALFAAAGTPQGPSYLTSRHLAEELGAGLLAADLVARAGVLASANDLAPSTAALVPGFLPFRRALLRHLRRPVGQSGSGPTLWALYPSLDAAEVAATELREAVRSGEVVAPGEASPAIHATTILPGSSTHAASAATNSASQEVRP